MGRGIILPDLKTHGFTDGKQTPLPFKLLFDVEFAKASRLVAQQRGPPWQLRSRPQPDRAACTLPPSARPCRLHPAQSNYDAVLFDEIPTALGRPGWDGQLDAALLLAALDQVPT
jgi:hypothetical protein